jgi:hydrogenase maturation protease
VTDRVIGIGCRDRGDDGVGPAVATEVAHRIGTGADVHVCSSDPTGLMDLWSGARSVVLVDAVLDGNPPGSVRVIDPEIEEIPDDACSVSSHGLGVGAVVALGESLGRMPERLRVVGVSAQDFEGDALTEPVARAVPKAADAVMELIEHA